MMGQIQLVGWGEDKYTLKLVSHKAKICEFYFAFGFFLIFFYTSDIFGS